MAELHFDLGGGEKETGAYRAILCMVREALKQRHSCALSVRTVTDKTVVFLAWLASSDASLG
ncbi:MAG: hypothetical protein AAF645_04570, partial [Myxococcota bacterium]